MPRNIQLLVDHSFSLERDVVSLFGGGTGNGTSNLSAVKGKGVQSVTRSGVGLHTIRLTDKWVGLLNFKSCVVDATSPTAWQVEVVSETVASTKQVKIAVFKNGTAADLTSDEKLRFELVLAAGTQIPSGV